MTSIIIATTRAIQLKNKKHVNEINIIKVNVNDPIVSNILSIMLTLNTSFTLVIRTKLII